MRASAIIIAALLAGAPVVPASSELQELKPPAQECRGERQPEKAGEKMSAPRTTVTSHKISVAGGEISYTATAGELPIINDSGETEAHIFFVSYSANNSGPSGHRPLLFMFNGGPGAASVWLHLGAAGPRRVKMLPDGRMPSPPFRLIDNEFTWLDVADLVFIDPVGTGYSRAIKPELTKKFAAVQGDIDSVGRFIRLYLARYERWNSPLFLVGESYGSFRAAGLSEYLVDHGIALNGIIMVSSIMNMQTTSFDNGNDLPYVLFLPSYAATAWYHKKLPPQVELEELLQSAEIWAAGDYLTALGRGDRLTPGERRAVVEKLAGFTGIDTAFIENRDLRIDRGSFINELLRKESKVIGFMDSRFTAENLDPASPSSFDPTIAAVRPPLTTAFNDYVRRELGFESDLEYYALGGGIGHWDWESKNSYAYTSDNLRNAFAKNPYMRLFVASGYFDLSTPYFATEYTLAHLGLTPALRGNVKTRRYRAGHMMYLDETSVSELKRDVAEFIGGACPAR